MTNILPFFLLFLLMEGVFGESVSVKEGDSVTLHTDLTEIQKDDVIDWNFGEKLDLILRLSKNINEVGTYLDDIFKDRLQVDKQTGDLTIRNIKTTDTGLYEVTSSGHTNKFTVNVMPADADADAVKPVSVIQGDYVTLNTGVLDIRRDDVIQWRFGPQLSLVAEINRKARKVYTYDGPDRRFNDRLKLDYMIGSLTIKNISTSHSGLYEVGIRSSGSKHTIHKSLTVAVNASGEVKSVLSVKEGDSVNLQTVLTEVQRADSILWMFRDTCIAEFKEAAKKFYTYDDVLNGRFRGRLKLDHQTGSLTITNIRTTDSGLYELKISSSRHTINQRFTVNVIDVLQVFTDRLSPAAKAWIGCGVVVVLLVAAAAVIYHYYKISQTKLNKLSVFEGETVPLYPSGTEIIKEDNIRWLFNKSPLAEIKRKSENTPAPIYVLHERFKGRLDWPGSLGPLTIKNIQSQDSGLYNLQIIRSENNIQTLEIFHVSVYDPPKSEAVALMSVGTSSS